MPFVLDRDLHRGWLVARVTGDLTIDDVVTFLQTARADLESRATPLLVDARGARTSMTAADAETAVQVVKRAVATDGMRAHVALVADDSFVYQWMLDYELRCAGIGVRVIRTFWQLPDAQRWLEILSSAGRFHR